MSEGSWFTVPKSAHGLTAAQFSVSSPPRLPASVPSNRFLVLARDETQKTPQPLLPTDSPAAAGYDSRPPSPPLSPTSPDHRYTAPVYTDEEFESFFDDLEPAYEPPTADLLQAADLGEAGELLSSCAANLALGFEHFPVPASMPVRKRILADLAAASAPVIVADLPSPRRAHQRPGFCYLRLFYKRTRKHIATILGPNPTCRAVARALLVVGATKPLSDFTLAAAVTFEPLHLHAFAPQRWSWSEAAKILAAYPLGLLGAPRANFGNALDLLGGTVHKDSVLDSYTAPVLQAIGDGLDRCPNKLSDPVFSLLQRKGLPVDSNATGSHPHPGMKAIEEHMLVTLAHQVSGDCTVAFMKLAKFNRLQRRNGRFTTLLNPTLTVRDHVRYGNVYNRFRQRVDTPNLFLHDCGHYLQPAEVSAIFASNPALKQIYFTAILPDELVESEPSWFPALYRLAKLDSARYAFILAEDGEYYEQPYSTLAWLRTRSISCGFVQPTVHSVEITARVCAHKLFCVTRDEAPLHSEWYVADAPDDVVLPEVDGRVFPHSAKRVPRKIFQSVLLHSLSLSTQRFTSTQAKVRTFQGNSEYAHIDADTWTTLAHVCYALSLDPATLEREAPINSLAGVFLARLRHLFHQHEWLQPTLSALGLTVSWGALLLPVLGVRIPDLHVKPGLRIPGWSYGAVATLASQLALLALGQTQTRTATWLLRTAALIVPQVAYLLPDYTIKPGFTVPSYIFGIGASLLVTGIITSYDGSSPHYEVREFIRKMPHRVDRRWRLRQVHCRRDGRRGVWSFGDDEAYGPPPAYSPEPPPTDSPPEDNGNPSFVVQLHGHGEFEYAFQEPEEVEVSSPGFAATVTGSSTSSLLDDDEAPATLPAPLTNPGPIIEDEGHQDADPGVFGLAPVLPPHRPTGEPLRLRFSLGENDVLEEDASYFSWCELPSGNDACPMPLQKCLLTSISRATGLAENVVWDAIWPHLPDSETVAPEVIEGGLTSLALLTFCYRYGARFRILGDVPEGHPTVLGLRRPHGRFIEPREYRIYVSPGHWSSEPAVPFRGAANPPTLAQPLPAHRRPTAFEEALERSRDFTGHKVLAPWRTYEASPARAKAYIRDLKAGTTGTIRANEGKHGSIPPDWTARMDALVDRATPRKVLLSAVLGAPGSSKSSGLVPTLRERRWLDNNSWKLAVPRVKLRQAWSASLELGSRHSWKVGTFETNLFKTASTLILDEISQFPPGYVDLAILTGARIQSVLVVGDVTQGNFHEPNADATLNASGSEALYFRSFCDEYRLFSNSIPRAVASAIGIPTRNKHRGFITVSQRAIDRFPIVCASDSEQKMYSSMGYDAYTFGTVQGQRFDTLPVQIVVSNATAGLVSRGHFVSALCRSNIGVYLILTGTQQTVRSLSADPFLSSLFCGTTRMAYQDLFVEELRGLRMRAASPLYWDPLAVPEQSVPAFAPQAGQRTTLFRGAAGNGLCYFRTLDSDWLTHAHNCLGAYPRLLDFVAYCDANPSHIKANPNVLFRTGFIFAGGVKREAVHVDLEERYAVDSMGWLDGLRALARISPGIIVGATLDLPVDRASDALKALMNPCPEELPRHIEHDRDFQRGPPTASFDESEAYLIASYGDLPSREQREEYEELLRSEQFRDDTSFVNAPGASGLEQFFPRHRSDDLLTFKRTVDKRLRFAPTEVNSQRYAARLFTGPILFDAWCRTTGVEPDNIPPFNEKLYAECIFENDFTKLTQKTQATLLNNAERADPDWRFTFVRIFMKSQLKVKLETLLSPFKAGQTIASFHDSVILVTGPMTRYISVVDEQLYAPEYYYHPGHAPLELSTWCSKHWKKVPLNSTNDYTSFDQSQTGEALALETHVLRAHHIPDTVLEYYIDLKLHLSCQFGELAVMRFTGEGPTLRFNSDFNAALVGVQYVVEPGVARCVAGDDLAINGVWKVRPGWERFKQHLTIVAKPEIVETAAFCSWLLTPNGALKEPRTVFAKLMIARDRGEEARVLPNLLNEVAVGYHLGDHVYEHLDELTLATHFWLVRYLVTHAPLRFRMLLATRSLEATLEKIWASLDAATQFDVRALSASLGELWMLQSRPARLAASLLQRVGGFSLRSHKVFDHILASSYRY
uniref:Non-structural replication polyprotein n=1 Tax=Diaporthe helianthi tymovirus 1 TaxID=3077438 RepID=A0AA96HA99_9VIRU|nr:MAG: replication-associated protein [Diaporthe helianthi tymovirus 1]